MTRDPRTDLTGAREEFWRTRAVFGQTPEDQGPLDPVVSRAIDPDFGDQLSWLMWLGAHEDRETLRALACAVVRNPPEPGPR